ncbi:MAG: 4-(cytidine 5'-diphospho)-2-C-methyl-D-erythritol kinase [Clostridia bacterium]|nr:4-(cytidine 5'-diphospho)-2-C-methyl-D-erythritol kinase [Clostridia bacterium]
MNSVKERAYAKINLFLDVIDKREDGFHSVRTVMHSLSLCDELTVTVTGKGSRAVKVILVGKRKLPLDSKNIAVMAALMFMETACIDCEVTIKLHKRIPIAAGLAGGSADAAAVLRAMNKLFSRPLSDKMLLALAARLGSDVPFCLIGGTALCEGRGERMTRLRDGISLHAVIAVANEWVSTPKAYAKLDLLYNNFDGSVPTESREICDRIVDAATTGVLPDKLYNIFEAATLPDCPKAEAIKARLNELGATHTLMSGSGPSVFGIFSTEQMARAAEETLRGEDIFAVYACSVK